MDEKQRYEAGMQVRRAVLGDAHVDRSLSNISEFNAEFQEMITRHAWGDIWTRPGLPRHTRSLITIAMLIGMNREGELKHLRAARNNGVTREEIKAAAECHLLRHPGGQRQLPLGRGSLRRAGRRIARRVLNPLRQPFSPTHAPYRLTGGRGVLPGVLARDATYPGNVMRPCRWRRLAVDSSEAKPETKSLVKQGFNDR